MNHDNMIDKIFWRDGKLVNAYSRKTKLLKHPNVLSYIRDRYDDSDGTTENLFRIHYHIDERPTCAWCKKPTKFVGRQDMTYQRYCCNSCACKGEGKGKKWQAGQRKHNLEKYGVACNLQIPTIDKKEIQEKIKRTCLERYGVESNLLIPGFYDRVMKTKREHHSFNKSKSEDDLFSYIKKKFPDVKRQHKDKSRYQFFCDFYIPSLDLFIELNAHWTHGGHPYDANDIDDQKKVEEWKSRDTQYFKNAIRTWTVLDVHKRNVACQNNLNYREVWTLREGKELIDSL